MYYYNEKRLLLVLLVLIRFSLLFAQEGRVSGDSLILRTDSLAADTLRNGPRVSPDAVDQTITHNCTGYRRTDFVNKMVYLVGDAVVTYGDITLKADSIVLYMDTGIVFATGRRDSTGNMAGLPVFKQGNEQFEAKALSYNFKTEKGRVIEMQTEQEDGYLKSQVTKKMDDGSLNISKSTYSTCDADHPHFYVGFNKAKVVPGEKIITGPLYMVIEDIPLPLIVPFGFIPIKRKEAESGIIVPKIGQTSELGYSLREGGYYFAVSDNFDLAMTGTLYTNGTWMMSGTSAYNKRYKYSGRISLSFANNVTGHKGLPDYSKTNNYRIDWSYAQDAKARPGSRFSASVSMSSSGFDKTNSYDPREHVNNQRQSSVSYSKTWAGTPFNFSTSLNHSQNMRNKTVALNLPKGNFTMSRIYPLKSRKMAGPAKWYQELQFQYSAQFDNQISTYDSLLFTSSVFNNMRNGFRHQAPVSIQIRPFRKLASFSISPQLSYEGVLYSQSYNKTWVPDYFDPDLNDVVPVVITDTLRGAFYGQAINASVSAGISPQIFGTFNFNPEGRLQAIRHVIKPSVGFSYVPVLENLTSDMYKTVQVDTAGNMRQYSIFEGNIYGTPSLGSRSGSISFGLTNIVEAKVIQKNDTTGKPTKVKIIDNLTLNTSYNIFADSLKWAPVALSYRTTLFENMGLAASTAFSLYGTDKNGKTINTFYFEQTKKLMRMTGLSITMDVDIVKLFSKKDKDPVIPSDAPGGLNQGQNAGDLIGVEPGQVQPLQGKAILDRYGYPEFDMPWSMRVAYSFYYTKPGLTSQINQTISIVGDVSLTKKTSIRYTTGFDIARKEITMTSISINRDLHCWEMSFEWIPTGYMKSWFFTIRPKSAIFRDLKYERRKDFHDQY